MLAVFYGTSCCGKTSIINELVEKHAFHRIIPYTTRRIRTGDNSKICISSIEFEKRLRNGEFIWVNKLFGEYYGNTHQSIEIAMSSIEYYILDYSIQLKSDCETISNKNIIIVPKGKSDLLKKIEIACRQDRQKQILAEYFEYYCQEQLELYHKLGYYIIINEYGKMDNAINEILQILTN